MFNQKEYFYIGLAFTAIFIIVIIWLIALAAKKATSKWLFGTTNLRFYIKELFKMYAAKEKSFFSKKRIESGIAFIVFLWGMIHWLVINITTIGYVGIVAWGTVMASICGYVIKQIQNEKLNP